MTTELSRGKSAAITRRVARVLVASRETTAHEMVNGLGQAGHDVARADSPETACASIAEQVPDLVMVDLGMSEEVAAVCVDLDVPFCQLGAGASNCHPESLGAFPLSVVGDACAVLVDLLLDREQIRRRTQQLEGLLSGLRDGSALVGRSPVMRRLQTTLSRAADGDATVLVEGARGAGKSMAARVIHCKSRRSNKSIVVHSGAEFDADSLQRSLNQAKGTTLLIEDVEQMPAAGQQALVRFLKERSSRPTSDGAPARVIATTSAHLPELVARGAFREDLYYRLHAYPIVVPSLRERTEDIALLAESFLDQLTASTGQRPVGFTPAARTMIESMPWPGNVAQLENVVRRAFVVAGGAAIDDRHLTMPAVASLPAAGLALPTNATSRAANEDEQIREDSIRPFEDEEKRILGRALKATGGQVRKAAQLLGIGRATLYRKIQQFHLPLR